MSEPDKADLQQRALGAYLGLAVGDALGATTEFLTPKEIESRYGVHRKIIGGGWLRLKPGQVTDDTEMSLALGRSILENGGVEAEAAARAFSDWMRTKPVDIGHTVRRGIVHFRNSGQPWVVESEFDAGNGACMRCLPVALFYWNSPVEAMIEASRAQSHVTHHNPVADAGTECVLQMVTAALRGEEKARLLQLAGGLVEQYPLYRFENRSVENPSGWIVHTLKAVFQALFAHESFEKVLIDVVNRGGDSDTTGAIAGMVAGALHGVNGIPRRWRNALNRSVREACEAQAAALIGAAGGLGR